MRALIAFIAGCMLLGTTAVGQRRQVVDLTRAPRRSDVPPAQTGQQLPVSLFLVSVRPSTCVAGQDISYEFELTNTSQDTLWLPSSLSPDQVSGAADVSRGYRELTMGLWMDDNEGPAPLGGVAALFGSDHAAGSLTPVLAGDTITMRAPSTCRHGAAAGNQLKEGLPQHVSVYVHMSMGLEPRAGGPVAKSSRYELTVVPRSAGF
jgi:hypothetical protein